MYYPNIFSEEFANELFSDLINIPVDYGKMLRNEIATSKRCSTDIKEFEDRYELDMDFPGYNKGEIKAELKKGYLIVSAEHKAEKVSEGEKESKDQAEQAVEQAVEETVEQEKPVKYLCKERFYGKTERSFYVGKEVKKEDIKAKFENGVLTLTVPKKLDRPDPEEEVISIL
ncbi:MAG: Hsp20 family protein [Eubacterium sp.]|nr:Hsp20 family protein [Eubacterium sp.]